MATLIEMTPLFVFRKLDSICEITGYINRCIGRANLHSNVFSSTEFIDFQELRGLAVDLAGFKIQISSSRISVFCRVIVVYGVKLGDMKLYTMSLLMECFF